MSAAGPRQAGRRSQPAAASQRGMNLLLLAVAVVAVAPSATVPAPPKSSAWNDTACHSPAEAGCATCLVANVTLPGTSTVTWLQRRWTGDCTGCLPGEPYGPQCGNCFPGVRPWYNGHRYGPPGSPPPSETTKPCSACSFREIHDYREALFAKPDGCQCSPDPSPPTGDCPASGPGSISCDCWCQDAAQMKILCKLDPEPQKFPGPCVLDRMLAQSRNLEFSAFCDPETGYYQTIQCGDKAPPALPPSPPMPPFNPPPPPALFSGADAHYRRNLQPGRKGYCWCVEPSYGIMNGTSAISHSDGARPPKMDCTETVQCELLNHEACISIGAQYCNWSLIPFDNGHVCGPLTARGPHSSTRKITADDQWL